MISINISKHPLHRMSTSFNITITCPRCGRKHTVNLKKLSVGYNIIQCDDHCILIWVDRTGIPKNIGTIPITRRGDRRILGKLELIEEDRMLPSFVNKSRFYSTLRGEIEPSDKDMEITGLLLMVGYFSVRRVNNNAITS